MPTRCPWVVFGPAAVAVVVALGAAWAMEHRRHRSALEQSDREMAAGRFGSARQRLTGLSTRWMGSDEVSYRLGLCEEALDHDEAALEAWSGALVRSPRAEEAALNSAALKMRKGSPRSSPPWRRRRGSNGDYFSREPKNLGEQIAIAHGSPPDQVNISPSEYRSQLQWTHTKP
jgi:hypothetical protein